jgi:hypothetical protein
MHERIRICQFITYTSYVGLLNLIDQFIGSTCAQDLVRAYTWIVSLNRFYKCATYINLLQTMLIHSK